jgi:hypothetical protein
VEIGVRSLAEPDLLIAQVVIPQVHEEMLVNLRAHPEFNARVGTYTG